MPILMTVVLTGILIPQVTTSVCVIAVCVMMQDYFETEVHPVEAFNTGDWGIFWAEDDKGLIAARCLYYKNGDKKELGPIYATSQEAIDAVKREITKHDCSQVNRGNWEGARILKIEEDGAFVGPYFDCHSTLREEGKYLILDRRGEIEHDHMGKYNV
jgi:hypothetical protein